MVIIISDPTGIRLRTPSVRRSRWASQWPSLESYSGAAWSFKNRCGRGRERDWSHLWYLCWTLCKTHVFPEIRFIIRFIIQFLYKKCKRNVGSCHFLYIIIEGSLEVKLPTIWTVEKQRWKSRNTVFFQWFVAPEGRKVGSLKRRVRSQLARWEMKNCTPLWREAHFQVKMYKAHHARTTFGSWDVEKVHAVVARSTFPSQNVQTHHSRTTFGSWDVEKVHAVVARSTFRSQKCKKLTVSDHFWKLPTSKKCTSLWREANFEVKMYKTHHSRTTFGSWDVEKVHVVVARSTFRSQKCTKLRVLSLFWRYDVEKVDTD